MQAADKQKQLRWLVLAVLVVLGSWFYAQYPQVIHTLFSYVVQGDVKGCITFIQSYGRYAALISFFLVMLVNITAVLPNIFLLAANGIIFGIVEGTVISWLGESVGVVISFFLMRYLFRDWASMLIQKNEQLKKVDEFSGQRGLSLMIVARCIPYVPSGLITALGALSSIKARDYIAATFIGKLPSAAIEVTMGHDIMSYQEHSVRLLVLILVSAVAYYLFARQKRTSSS